MCKNWRLALLALVRDKNFLIWCLGLPLGLATIFIFMFQPIDKLAGLDQLPIAAVRLDATQAASPQGQAYTQFLEALGSAADGASGSPTITVDWQDSAEEARQAVQGSQGAEKPLLGLVRLGPDSQLTFEAAPTNDSVTQMEQSVITSVCDSWQARMDAAVTLAAQDPALLAHTSVQAALADATDLVQKVSLTENSPRETCAFYFALLGFTALMCAQNSLLAALTLVPGASACGSRITASGQPRGRQMLIWLMASWTASFAGLVICLAYVCWAASIDFGARTGLVVLALAAASFMATGLGGLVAVAGPRETGAKEGVLTTVTCVGALFAGLYGEPVMEMANNLAEAAPVTAWINPVRQVMESLSALIYYDSLAPFWMHLGLVAAAGAICCTVGVLRLRRLRRESV